MFLVARSYLLHGRWSHSKISNICPCVMVALKTKTATRLILNSMEHNLEEIRQMGLLGEGDANIIHRDLVAKMLTVQKFPYVLTPVSNTLLLLNIPWVDGDGELVQRLQEAGQIIKLYSNDVIVSQGHLPGGIFIILQGVIRVLLTHQSESLERQDHLKWNISKVPYYLTKDKVEIESVSSTSHGTDKLELHGFYAKGCIIGEASFLNEKPGHKTYRCVTYVETMFVSYLDLVEIVQRSADSQDPLSPVEMRMWKAVAMRQAVRLIHNSFSHSSISRLQIFSRMADSYIIDGKTDPVLTVSQEDVATVVLIQGYVSQFYNELTFVGPCILPITQQKFISHPEELGVRVIYLIIKTHPTEENIFESIVPEEPQMANYEDSLTISSGSSDTDPYRRHGKSLIVGEDDSDLLERMFTSGIAQDHLKKLEEFKIRQKHSFTI